MSVTLTKEMIDGAKSNQSKYGIPASITLGQIILESSGSYPGGLSGLAYKANNLFGVKGTGTAGSYSAATKEQGKNGLYTTTAKFAKYATVQDSIDAHGKLLSKERYKKETQNAKTAQEYAEGIKRGGYATDADYVSKLMRVIDTYGLEQYDDSSKFGQSAGALGQETQVNENTEVDLLGKAMLFILIAGVFVLGVYLFYKSLDQKAGVKSA